MCEWSVCCFVVVVFCVVWMSFLFFLPTLWKRKPAWSRDLHGNHSASLVRLRSRSGSLSAQNPQLPSFKASFFLSRTAGGTPHREDRGQRTEDTCRCFIPQIWQDFSQRERADRKPPWLTTNRGKKQFNHFYLCSQALQIKV